MGNLILNSLEIRNFRGFRHLQYRTFGAGESSCGEKQCREIKFMRGASKGGKQRICLHPFDAPPLRK